MRYCCEYLADLQSDYFIEQEKHGKEYRFFVHFQNFNSEYPSLHVSIRLRFCPFCGAKLSVLTPQEAGEKKE